MIEFLEQIQITFLFVCIQCVCFFQEIGPVYLSSYMWDNSFVHNIDLYSFLICEISVNDTSFISNIIKVYDFC